MTPEYQKAQTERILLGAMLRESAGLFRHIGSLNPRRFEHAANGLGPALAAVYECALNGQPVNTIAIARKVQIQNLPQIEAEKPEIDLGWAVDTYNSDYAVWAELAAQNAASQQWAIGVEAIAAKLAEERQRLCAFQESAETNWEQEFVDWIDRKISGKLPIYPTQNRIQGAAKMVSVYEPGDLEIIAGRPGMGKTHYILCLMLGFMEAGAKGTFFSLEMTKQRILQRLTGMLTGISPKEDWTRLSEGQQKQVFAAAERLMKMPLDIQDKLLQLPQIEAHSFAQKMKGQLDFVAIDYAQICDGGFTDEYKNVTAVSNGAMRIMKNLDVPTFLLSQITRDNERRGGDKRPTLADLKGSGALEANASGVTFLYRPEYYKIESYEDGSTTQGIAEIIRAKSRYDFTGTEKCGFNPIRGFAMLNEPTHSAPVSAAQSVAPPVSRMNDEDIPF